MVTIAVFALLLIQTTNAAPSTDITHLLPTFTDSSDLYELTFGSPNNELEAVETLPDITAEEALATGIKTILFWSMLLTLIAIIIAAIYYLISRGKEEDLTKAKNIILYLIIGIAIMAAAYGVVSGIAQFKFFENLPTTGDENPS